MSAQPLPGPRASAWDALREQFLLEPGVAFLNHGSFGACPRTVLAEYQRWQMELERQPVEFLGRRFTGLMEAARARLAAYVGAGRDDLVYVPNATTGMNIVARSLRLGPGDEVLTTDHEYGAINRTWTFLCEKRSAAYRPALQPLPHAGPGEFVERLWAEVTPRTRVISFSHVTAPTALVRPVAEICRRAREVGILTVVDGAHAVGQVPLDLEALGADFYTSNCHKWLCAPKGSAFLYARPERQPLVEPLAVSWGWRSETPGPSRFVDEQEWIGTRDPAAYLATPAAIDFLAENHWDSVQAACHALGVEARRRLNDLTGQAPICEEDDFAQMFSVRLPPCDTQALKRRLYDEYRVEVPLILWQGQPLMRVSIQGYNTPHDVDRLLEALAALLPQTRTD